MPKPQHMPQTKQNYYIHARTDYSVYELRSAPAKLVYIKDILPQLFNLFNIDMVLRIRAFRY